MGTTESIFLEQEEGHHVEQPSPLPRGSLQCAQQQQQQQHRPPTTTPQRPVTRQNPPPSDRPPPRRTIIQQSDESSKEKAPPSCGSFQLNGIVLGLPKSGKRTLLQRLEGKEPVFCTSRNSKSSGDTDSAAKSEESTVASAPYQAPPHLPAFDGQIHLMVQASKRVSKNTEADFYVVLIDPRHDRVKLGKYLAKTLHSALRAQGYGRDAAAPKRPFCLCLLRNFRDLIPDDDPNNDCIVSESDVTAWTMEVLQGYPEIDSVLLQCTDTSLLNFFGLGALHRFIYQAYVKRKQYDLEQELRLVREAATRARHEALPAAAASYEEHLAEIARLTRRSNSSSSSGRHRHRNNNDDETATTATSSGAGRRKIVPQHEEDVSSSRRKRASSGESSSTLPSIQQSLENAKDALEAFLESDSDEGEHDSVHQQGNGNEDDSDEEDFFYDESGIRNDAGRYESTEAQSMCELGNSKEVDIPQNGSSEHTKKSIPMDKLSVRAKENGTNENDSNRGTQDAPASNNIVVSSSPGVSDDDHLVNEELRKSQQSDTKIEASVIDDSEQNVVQANAAPYEHGQQGAGIERSSADSPQQSSVSRATAETSEIQDDASVEGAGPMTRKEVDDDNDDSNDEFYIDVQTTEHEACANADKDTLVEEHRVVSENCRSPATPTSAGVGSDKERSEQLLRNETDLTKAVVVNADESSPEKIEDENDGDSPVKTESGRHYEPAEEGPIARVEAPLPESNADGSAAAGVKTERPSQVTAAVERSPADGASNVTKSPEPGQLSEAARAALAVAHQDFERMMQVTDDEKAKKTKKKKKDDSEKKKKSRKEKKS